ncbi:MAG: hypothetical protein IH987_13955 [Planctomycetes bacterium]|nr:hypothetical protein [Planctomycetota bacterium]
MVRTIVRWSVFVVAMETGQNNAEMGISHHRVRPIWWHRDPDRTQRDEQLAKDPLGEVEA